MTRTTRPILPPNPPRIQTPRLLLRPFSLADLPDYVLLRRQPEVMKWTSKSRCDETISQTQEWMARSLPREDPTTFDFSIEELERPGVVIGSAGCGLLHGKRPEIGYMFREESWGKGYATEAAKAVLDAYWWLERKEVDVQTDTETENDNGRVDRRQDPRTELAAAGGDDEALGVQVETVFAVTEAANTRSRNVLEKLGFVKVKEYRDSKPGGTELLDYVLKRPER